MEVNIDDCWWTALDKNDSLELAFTLSKKALVLWNNFNFTGELKDKLNAIKPLPAAALKEIDILIRNKNEGFDKKKLTNLFTLFVTPVLQIRDGELNLPYVVKSSFLSVFNILKGILSSRNKSQALNWYSLSISRALDAIKISNILTSDEISKLTQKYFLLSVKNKNS